MAKLVAIGDSLAQGFQSGAILKTDLSFPAMIARSFGLSVGSSVADDFRIPSYNGNGLPINIEALLLFMSAKLGTEISLDEWILHFPTLLGEFLDDTEYLYERGQGSIPSSFNGQFHNLSIWGFRVLDTLTVHSDYCDRIIETSGEIKNNFLSVPSAAMYRTARQVLNPAHEQQKGQWTQLDNLQAICDTEGGVENLIVWMGANDCLGTVGALEIKQMSDNFASIDPEKRHQLNLTHPKIFGQEYSALIAKIKKVISPTTRVFVATIPYVTIPPIATGIGKLSSNSKYFEYYGRFFCTEDNFNHSSNSHLTGAEIQKIDRIIDEFNQIIRDEVALAGDNWHLVDTGGILNSLAVKRNHSMDAPDRPLKAYYASLGFIDHPLLQLDPIPSVLSLRTENGIRTSGGLFSLDGMHPSTIGYGIVAEAFLIEMQKSGVPNADPTRLDWSHIIAQDSLFQSPPVLWNDIVNSAEKHSILWDAIFKVLS
jgi:GDSL-like Lipase/Acylhydrolase